MNGLESVVPAKMSERPDRAVACEPKMYDSGIARRSIKVSVYRDWIFGDDTDGS
jgi:hypothetical protein